MSNPFENLPVDIIKHIASFLNYRSLGRFNRVAPFFKKTTDQTLIEKREQLAQKILSSLIEPSYSGFPSNQIEKDIDYLIANGKRLETFSALVQVYKKLQKSEINEDLKTKFEKILLKYFKIAGLFCIQTANCSPDEGPAEACDVEASMMMFFCLSIVSNEKLDDQNLHLLYDFLKMLTPESSPNSYEAYLSQLEKSVKYISNLSSPEQKEEMIEKAKSFLKELIYLPESSLAPCQ